MGSGGSKPFFDPETWCEGEIDKKRPIKSLACLAIAIMELLTPFTKYIKTQFDILSELIFGNKFTIEMIILLAPIVPIFYLIGYFFDTLV